MNGVYHVLQSQHVQKIGFYDSEGGFADTVLARKRQETGLPRETSKAHRSGALGRKILWDLSKM